MAVPFPPFITELDDEDARWLDGAGERRRVRAGEEIASGGVPPKHLFVVIEGEFEESTAAGGAVRAATDGVLLCIPREELEAKAANDPAFEHRMIAKLAPKRRPPRRPPGQAKKPAEPAPEGSLHVPTVIERLLRGDF
jgi:CRP-like cAMP-binding protein